MFEEENKEKTELETTKELEVLSDLNNQIFEVNQNIEEKREVAIEEQGKTEFFTQPTKGKLKDKFSAWWKKRTKKQRILIILGIVIFLLLIAVGVFFLIHTLKKEEPIPAPIDVIVQEENYRYENGVLAFKISGDEILIGNGNSYTPAPQKIVLSIEE